MTFTVTDLMISALPDNGSANVLDRAADTADISTCEESTAGQCGDVPDQVPDSTCEESTAGQCGDVPQAPDEASTCEESTAGLCTHLPTCMKSKGAIGEEERAMLQQALEAAIAAHRR